ncbi:MAG: sigma-54-dependent Fis family transcriptional regulator [Planctomycetes bacterium]|nr:sigma-54-dependent Fis family transcriptional regulator [Planctomycetota bacterium]
MTPPGGRDVRRRAAVLGRIRKALDAFYLLQDIDWQFDVRETLDKILELALKELKLEAGSGIERAMIILAARETEFECHAGWFSGGRGLDFSRSVIREVLETGRTLACDDVAADDRFARNQSVRRLELASFVCIPVSFSKDRVGAFFVDTSGAGKRFLDSDREFLEEFVQIITPYLKTALVHRIHLDRLKGAEEAPAEFRGLVGASPAMRRLFEQIRLVAGSSATVLVQGPTGSGKELVARAIHAESARSRRAFVAANCSAIPPALMEAELFGHRKGAFTGATADREGLVAGADGGTLFLDEIADIGLDVQAKLLRFLQEGEFRPIGSDRVSSVDARVVAATHQDLRRRVAAGQFREDLFYRVNVLPIEIPPLAAREGDIPLLVEHFLARFARDERTKARRASPEVLRILAAQEWPGNVRQLEHVLRRAALLAEGSELEGRHLPPEIAGSLPSGGAFGLSLEDVRRARGEAGEKDYVRQALAHARGHASGRIDLLEKAVGLIGDCSTPTLRRRIKKLGIDLAEFVPKRSGKKRGH